MTTKRTAHDIILEVDMYLMELSERYWFKYENTNHESFHEKYHKLHDLRRELKTLIGE
jgi:hypothetical protein